MFGIFTKSLKPHLLIYTPVKNLGLVFDFKLKFDKQIKSYCEEQLIPTDTYCRAEICSLFIALWKSNTCFYVLPTWRLQCFVLWCYSVISVSPAASSEWSWIKAERFHHIHFDSHLQPYFFCYPFIFLTILWNSPLGPFYKLGHLLLLIFNICITFTMHIVKAFIYGQSCFDKKCLSHFVACVSQFLYRGTVLKAAYIYLNVYGY